MNIIDPDQELRVETVSCLIFGSPGAWKTSLAQTSELPFTLDFDKGIHRSFNRKRAGRPEKWMDAASDAAWSELGACKTIVVDTVGRMLDMMSVYICEGKGNSRGGGNLSIQGWGAMKSCFSQWCSRARSLGKDVVFIAHDKEEKEGDVRVWRPDIQGGSYSEVMKSCDMIGFMSIQGGQRILDFSPADTHPGKNPAQWAPITIPSLKDKPDFLAGLLKASKAAMSSAAKESVDIAGSTAEWKARMAALSGGRSEPFDDAIAEANKLPKGPLQTAAKKIIMDRIKALGMSYDKKSGKVQMPPVTEDDMAVVDEMAAVFGGQS